jgi:multidrug efflux pump subunit AcrA (membrane-fusion protein)
MREEYVSLSLVMSTRLNTCMDALRVLARLSELEANRLLTAELRIRDFLTPVGTNRAAQRAALEELDNAVSREAELRPREASFWQEISDFIARRLATLNFD